MVVGIAVLTVLMSGSGDDDGDAVDIQFNGQSLPAFDPEGVEDPAVGSKAPIFVTTDFDGNRHVIGSGGGPADPARIVGFFAHWCPVCAVEMPEVASWLEANPLPERVVFNAVSTLPDRGRPSHPPEAWFAAGGWSLPVMVDNGAGDIAASFGMGRVPSFVVLDSLNRVLVRIQGAIDDAQLEELVALAESGVV